MRTFSFPAKGCFAGLYFNDSENLKKLCQRIKAVAEVEWARKETEWQILSTQHADLTREIAESTYFAYLDECGRRSIAALLLVSPCVPF